MRIQYSFSQNMEPSDEQLQSLMKEVCEEVKVKAKIAETLFLKQLQQLVKKAREVKLDKIQGE